MQLAISCNLKRIILNVMPKGELCQEMVRQMVAAAAHGQTARTLHASYVVE